MRSFFKLRSLQHSAKGTTWENHKYIKRIDGTYYYPDSYEGGRHLSSISDNRGKNDDSPPPDSSGTNYILSTDDIERLAKEVIRGDYGNGQVRKDLLGEYYQQIQDRVNEILLGKTGSSSVSSLPSSVLSEGAASIEKTVKAATPSSSVSLDFETIFSVYRR